MRCSCRKKEEKKKEKKQKKKEKKKKKAMFNICMWLPVQTRITTIHYTGRTDEIQDHQAGNYGTAWHSF